MATLSILNAGISIDLSTAAGRSAFDAGPIGRMLSGPLIDFDTAGRSNSFTFRSDAAAAGADRLTFGRSHDFIETGRGHDTVFAGAGDDTIDAGGGADSVDGGLGNDTIWMSNATTRFDLNTSTGGDGFMERAVGGGGDDFIFSGSGNDIIWGDNLHGVRALEDGNDTVSAGGGNDTVHAGNGATNFLMGGDGNDLLNGGNGLDSLWGDGGNDRLYGGEMADMLVGGLGQDSLWGGAGIDTHEGGAGADHIGFSTAAEFVRGTVRNTQVDRINQFNGAEGDRIEVNRGALVNFDGTVRLDADTNPGGWNLFGSHAGRFVWDSDDRILYWDDNGAGRSGGEWAIAWLPNTPTLSLADIIVI